MDRGVPNAITSFLLLLICACGPRPGAADGEETPDDGPLEDLPSETELCNCPAGTTCVLTLSDICEVGCHPIPPSCGDSPNCDPACNWDLCNTVDCPGEITTLCDGEQVTAWACPVGFGPCNPWLDQDCPGLEACRPRDDGSPEPSFWTTASCTLAGPAVVGEPCMRSQGVYAGTDDCQAGSICWDVDPDTSVGACVPLCAGAPHDPQCPTDTRCALADPMYAAICLPPCDPLADPCAPGYVCTSVGDTLACMPARADAAALGEVCEHPNDCAAGLACSDELQDCAGERCCAGFCDLDAPTCPPQTPTCAPTSAGEQSGLAHVGVCR